MWPRGPRHRAGRHIVRLRAWSKEENRGEARRGDGRADSLGHRPGLGLEGKRQHLTSVVTFSAYEGREEGRFFNEVDGKSGLRRTPGSSGDFRVAPAASSTSPAGLRFAYMFREPFQLSPDAGFPLLPVSSFQGVHDSQVAVRTPRLGRDRGGQAEKLCTRKHGRLPGLARFFHCVFPPHDDYELFSPQDGLSLIKGFVAFNVNASLLLREPARGRAVIPSITPYPGSWAVVDWSPRHHPMLASPPSICALLFADSLQFETCPPMKRSPGQPSIFRRLDSLRRDRADRRTRWLCSWLA